MPVSTALTDEFGSAGIVDIWERKPPINWRKLTILYSVLMWFVDSSEDKENDDVQAKAEVKYQNHQEEVSSSH